MAPAKDGYYLVAAVAAGTETTGRRDYHFYRQMSDGSWWHKPGKIAPTNLDAEGNVITNPELQDRDYTKGSKEGNPNRRTGYDNFQIHYNKFVGYYYVPMAGLQVAMGGLPDHIIESPAMRKEREFNQACARLSSNIREPEIGTHFQYNANLWFSRSL